MTSRTDQLIVGLPSAGKTTFLAALWHVVEYDGIDASLVLDSLEGDREYLNEIRGRWLRCEPQRRTSSSSEASVTMSLRDRNAGTTTQVHMPDMSGESFRAQWTARRWTRHYDDLVSCCNGVMLFVHPIGVREPRRIDEADALVAALGSAEEFVEQPARSPLIPAWNPDDAATQVQLVELRQFIGARSDRRLRLAIVISAWDIAGRTASSPEHWLRGRLPLLWQYGSANDDTWVTDIFGVSAQGGDFEKDADRLLNEHVPAKRIIVIKGETKTHDITLPVKALMTELEPAIDF